MPQSARGIRIICLVPGDIVALVEKAAANIDAEKAMRAAEKMRKGKFDLDDLSEQLAQVEKTGAESVVVSCASCRLNFEAGRQKNNWNKRVDSLVELVADHLIDDQPATAAEGVSV